MYCISILGEYAGAQGGIPVDVARKMLMIHQDADVGQIGKGSRANLGSIPGSNIGGGLISEEERLRLLALQQQQQPQQQLLRIRQQEKRLQLILTAHPKLDLLLVLQLDQIFLVLRRKLLQFYPVKHQSNNSYPQELLLLVDLLDQKQHQQLVLFLLYYQLVNLKAQVSRRIAYWVEDLLGRLVNLQ